MYFIKKYKINRLIKKITSMQKSRIHSQPSEETIAKEIALYHQLAALYASLQGHKKVPFAREMVLACLRTSATLDDADAQYKLATKLLDEAKFRDDLEKKEVFKSRSNERQIQQLFEEAHAYLLAAENLRHIEAKRLRGLCYINGWGVVADKNKGFELVVESIEQENAWDKVTQIFADMGLNKPEFFAALMQRRKS